MPKAGSESSTAYTAFARAAVFAQSTAFAKARLFRQKSMYMLWRGLWRGPRVVCWKLMAGQPQRGRESNAVIKTHEVLWRAEAKDPKSQAVHSVCRGCRIAQDRSGCRTGYVSAWKGGDGSR